MLQIRIANIEDYDNIKDFYDSLIDSMANSEFNPGWIKDIYPDQKYLIKSIENNELYVGELDGQIVTCMVVNHEYSEDYNNVKWSIEATDEEIFIIHTLGVHPAFTGQGIAKQMVEKVIEVAHSKEIKTIRLDVREGNIPAEKVYVKMGFKYLDTIKIFYENSGWTNFKIYELII